MRHREISRCSRRRAYVPCVKEQGWRETGHSTRAEAEIQMQIVKARDGENNADSRQRAP
jgi:hypothetical protein